AERAALRVVPAERAVSRGRVDWVGCAGLTSGRTRLLVGFRRRSDIQVLDVQRVLLDELASGLDLITHEDREELVGLHGVVDTHLQKSAGIWVHRRFPELTGVHFA